MQSVLVDVAGRRRSPATLPGYARGRPPRNKGLQYPADPPSVEEIIRVMRCAGERPEGLRMRAVIVVLWRAGLRISEALAPAESDLDPRRGSILVRCGKGGKRREVGMDAWAWEQLTPWLQLRTTMPSARCCASSTAPPAVDHGQRPPPARSCGALPHAQVCAGRFAPHQLRTCPCRRNRTRRSPAGCHPAPTRTPQPGHHIDLPARHRQHGDHRDGPRAPSTDDPRERATTRAAVTTVAGRSLASAL